MLISAILVGWCVAGCATPLSKARSQQVESGRQVLLRCVRIHHGNGLYEHRLFVRNKSRAVPASATIETVYENPPNLPVARKQLKRLAPTQEKLVLLRYGPAESRLTGSIVEETVEGQPTR